MSQSVNSPSQKIALYSITLELDDFFDQKNISKIQKVVFYTLALTSAAIALSTSPMIVFLKGSLLVNPILIGSLALAALNFKGISTGE
ncbi:MAG: hypothetical protein V4489_09515 [Chlamydiota bacterium]